MDNVRMHAVLLVDDRGQRDEDAVVAACGVIVEVEQGSTRCVRDVVL